MAQYLCICVGAYWFSAMLISKWPPGSHIGIFGFRTLTLVWLWISTANLSGTILIYMGRSLFIFSDVTLKMAAWRPYWIFSCDQAALQMVFSVCLSFRPSVHHTFLTMFPSSYHHEIFRSYYHWQRWRPCRRSRSEVKGQGHRGRNPTLPFPDCNSSLNSRMMMKWCI